jgi:hypothetical protein
VHCLLKKTDIEVISVLCEQNGYATHAGKRECWVNSGLIAQKKSKIYGLKWKIYVMLLPVCLFASQLNLIQDLDNILSVLICFVVTVITAEYAVFWCWCMVTAFICDSPQTASVLFHMGSVYSNIIFNSIGIHTPEICCPNFTRNGSICSTQARTDKNYPVVLCPLQNVCTLQIFIWLTEEVCFLGCNALESSES